MANFNQADSITRTHESGYSNNPNDFGGETWNGIARNYHPLWAGWEILDKFQNKKRLPELIKSKLKALEHTFYKHFFWDKIKGDDIPHQELANILYDIAVNGNHKRAGRFLQQNLNILNRGGADYPDIEVDGIIGKNTIKTLKKYMSKRDVYVLIAYIGADMLHHWKQRAMRKESQEEFTNGIGNRWVTNIIGIFKRALS